MGNKGIEFTSGASLTVQNCVVRHVLQSGIEFAPNATSKLSVSNSLVADNGINGIIVAPNGSGTVAVALNRVEANNNNSGIRFEGDLSTGTVKGTLVDSVANGNSGAGFFAGTAPGFAPVTFMSIRSTTSNNSTGITVSGTGAVVRLLNSTVTGNTDGWLVFSSGAVQSYGNNSIDGNNANETAPPSATIK